MGNRRRGIGIVNPFGGAQGRPFGDAQGKPLIRMANGAFLEFFALCRGEGQGLAETL
jgi:hypothetical protein